MARTVTEVKESIVSTIESIDPSIDVAKGPVYDLLIQPVAPEISKIEEDVEHLTALYSQVVAETATDEEAKAFALNYGLTQDAGKKATGFVSFFRNTRPIAGEIIEILAGSIISNSDDSLVYQTTEQVIINGDYADTYYNSVRNLYEITAPIEAVSSGEENNIPAYKVVRLPSTITGIDGVENREKISGGTSAETIAHLVERTIVQLKGLDKGSPNGVEAIVRNFDPSNVDDVSVVTAKDRTLFTRYTTAPSMDIYVIGEDENNSQYITTAIGGEEEFILENPPVLQVDSVQVNGEDVNFTFLPDTSEDTRKSARALDKVLLDNPLIALDVVDLRYIYNKLIRDLQDKEFSEEQRFFNTDILIRSAIGAYITFQANVKIASSFDPIVKLTEIENAVLALIQQDAFVEEYIPNDIRDAIKASVSGILTFIITKFTRTIDGTVDIETITFEANEKPMLDGDTFNINIRQ